MERLKEIMHRKNINLVKLSGVGIDDEISALEGIDFGKSFTKRIKKTVKKTTAKAQQAVKKTTSQAQRAVKKTQTHIKRNATNKVLKAKAKYTRKIKDLKKKGITFTNRIKNATKLMIKDKAFQDTMITAFCASMGQPQLATSIIQAKDMIITGSISPEQILSQNPELAQYFDSTGLRNFAQYLQNPDIDADVSQLNPLAADIVATMTDKAVDQLENDENLYVKEYIEEGKLV